LGRSIRVRWSETIVQKDSDEAEFDRMIERTTALVIGDMCISAVPRSDGPP
jgi:hypothetical protein